MALPRHLAFGSHKDVQISVGITGCYRCGTCQSPPDIRLMIQPPSWLRNWRLSRNEKIAVAVAATAILILVAVNFLRYTPPLSESAMSSWEDLESGNCSSLYSRLWREDVERNKLTEAGFCRFIKSVAQPRLASLKKTMNSVYKVGNEVQGVAGRTYLTKSGYDFSTRVIAYRVDGQPRIALYDLLTSVYKVGYVEQDQPETFGETCYVLARGLSSDRALLAEMGINGYTILDPSTGSHRFQSLDQAIDGFRKYARR